MGFAHPLIGAHESEDGVVDNVNGGVLAERFRLYAGQMGRESDSGAIIVGAGILEDLLREGLVARLVPSLERDDELLEGSYAPCSTFGAKIDLAYRVGSIGAAMRSILHLVRKMRNEAAHAGEHRDLASPELQNRLRELSRLNRSLVEVLWEVIQSATVAPGIPLPTSADAVSEFVGKVGWRSTCDVVIAILAAGLSTLPETQVALRPPTGETNDSI